jgi:NTP pyrophosphatase (non-canonical NTP hydrolase)
MEQEQRMVLAFMAKNEFVVHTKLEDIPISDNDDELVAAGKYLIELSEKLKHRAARTPGDHRLVRAFLLIEEVGELMAGMGDGDEVEMADALADIAYIVLGTAVTFSVPLKTVFDEVHRSNMTKTRRREDRHLKADKGAAYSPPDVKRALIEGRCSL